MREPTVEGIRSAAKTLLDFGAVSPLVPSQLLSQKLDADVWLKIESCSPIASFKWRGAVTAISRAASDDTLCGVVTSSTGNHGQGVAYAASLLGTEATVFLPLDANPTKMPVASSVVAVGSTPMVA